MKKLIRNSVPILVLLIALPLWANGSEIVYKTDPGYMLHEFSTIESGNVLLSNQHAVTRNEFHQLVAGSPISAADGVTTEFSLRFRPYIAGFYSPYPSFDNYPVPLLYLFEDQQDILSFQMSIGIDDSFFSKIVYSVGASQKALSGPGAYHPVSMEYYAAGDSPDEGYLSFSGDHLSLTIGRFGGGVGHGQTGNLFQNSRAPYYDQFQFSLFAPFVKISYMLGTSNYQLTDDERQLQNNAPLSQDYSKTWGAYAEKASDIPRLSDNLKIFAFHRIEFKPFDNLRFGLGEMNLVGGKFPDLNMINPFGMYHDTYDADYHSYTFLFDVSYVPVRRHMVYCEFLSNEIRVPGERNNDPTAVGYQAGYWWILPIQHSAKHRLGLEITHLDTWTYSDIVPYLTMYQRQMRRDARYDIPLGFAYGGDCEHAAIHYTVLNADGFFLDITLQRLHKGEVDFQIMENGKMPYSNAHKHQGRPSGIVEMWSTIESSCSVPVTDMISVDAKIHYSYIENFHHDKNNNTHLVYCSSGLTMKF